VTLASTFPKPLGATWALLPAVAGWAQQTTIKATVARSNAENFFDLFMILSPCFSY